MDTWQILTRLCICCESRLDIQENAMDTWWILTRLCICCELRLDIQENAMDTWRIVTRLCISCGAVMVRDSMVVGFTTIYNAISAYHHRSLVSLGTSVSSTNKSDHHDITKLLLRVGLNTINLIKGNNKITKLRTILQRESKNS